MMVELKPCPFCGHEVSLAYTPEGNCMPYGVTCYECDYIAVYPNIQCRKNESDDHYRGRIAKFWNSRQPSPELLKSSEGLRGCPFCGHVKVENNRQVVHIVYGFDNWPFGIRCSVDKVIFTYEQAKEMHYEGLSNQEIKAFLAEAWNRRPANEG